MAEKSHLDLKLVSNKTILFVQININNESKEGNSDGSEKGNSLIDSIFGRKLFANDLLC